MSRKARLQSLNPVFHAREKKEDNDVLSPALIKLARRTGSLNLSGRGLASVPSKTWNIHELDKNDINVKFDAEPADEEGTWWNQNIFTNLDLSSNVLTYIPSDIQNLQDITILNLHDNALTTLPTEIGSLQHLTKLNVSHNKISVLPKEFFQLSDLKQLNLSYNELTEINSELSDLVMLETLDLSNNQLTYLPEGIGYLTRLNTLMLSHNKLKELPSDLISLRNLQSLDIMKNDISVLPENMVGLRKLECVYAQHNDIVDLPTFEGCELMKEIHFSNNFIKEIPNDFCENLPHLKILDLRDNKIDKLPDEIAYLQALIRLDLSNNSINSLPNSLATLAHLVSLQLDGNPIRSIRRDVIQAGTIRIMKLLKERSAHDDKKLNAKPSAASIGEEQSIYPDKFKMRKSQTLSIAMKNINNVPDDVFQTAQDEAVQIVDLSKNAFSETPEGLSYLEATLTQFDISHNLLTSVPDFLSQFNRLSYLNVANNMLTDLPDNFDSLQSLREININNNKFQLIPVCIYKLVGLEILLARDNQITEIDATNTGLAALPRLANLDLANNNISYIPPILGNLKKLMSLELNGNSFRQPRHQIIEKGTEAILSYLRDRIPTN